jgi:hypothetical protein
VELTGKGKEKFCSARKIPHSGKPEKPVSIRRNFARGAEFFFVL